MAFAHSCAAQDSLNLPCVNDSLLPDLNPTFCPVWCVTFTCLRTDFILQFVKFSLSCFPFIAHVCLSASEAPHSWNKWHQNVLTVLWLYFLSSCLARGRVGLRARTTAASGGNITSSASCVMWVVQITTGLMLVQHLSFSINKLMYGLLFFLASLHSPTRCPVMWRSPYLDRLCLRTRFNRSVNEDVVQGCSTSVIITRNVYTGGRR